MFIEKRVAKPLKTWWNSLKTFLFKSLENLLDYRDSMKIVAVPYFIYRNVHCIIVLLNYHIIVLLYYHIIVLFYYCIIILLYYCIIVLLSGSSL